MRNMLAFNNIIIFIIYLKIRYILGATLSNTTYFENQLQRTVRQANVAECVQPVITNGLIQIIKRKSSARINFLSLNVTCSKNYVLQPPGDNLISCLNGFWDVDDIPQCKKCIQRSKNTQIDDNTDAQLICPESSNENDIFTTDCGYRIDRTHQPFVFNGLLSKFAEFPWHVGIYKKDQNDSLPVYRCGGSLVTANSILTVAHCLSDAYGKIMISRQYYIVAGKYHIDYNADRETAQKRQVIRINLHPRYKGEYVNYAWDIAVVLVNEPFQTSSLIHPICVDWTTSFENEHLSPDKYGEIAGWGKAEINFNAASRELRVLKVPFINAEQCNQLVPSTFLRYITPDKFCAGYTNGSSVCDGDSGGGLVFAKQEKKQTKYYIRGLVSVGLQQNGRCDNYKYSTFTKVSDYISFIRDCIENKNMTSTQYYETSTTSYQTEIIESSTEVSVSCTTPNKEQAKCVSIYECKLFVNALQNNPTDEVIKFIKDSICGKPEEKKVCCGSTINFLSVIHSNPVTSNAIVHKNLNLLPEPGVCGRRTIVRQGKITGGTAAELLDYPWMALLEFGTVEQSAGFLCSGFLINERYVVTAAHCAIKQRDADRGQVFRVRLGEYDLDTEIDCVDLSKGTGLLPDGRMCADPPVNVDIEQIIVHPSFNRIKRINEIALLRLARNISYTNFIKPICLPRNGERSLPGRQLSVAGWGRTDFAGEPSSVKLKAFISALSYDECSKRLENTRSPVNNISHVCSGDENGKGDCQGDTGGPLMSTLTDSKDIYAEGVISFGLACGISPSLSVAAKVTSSMDWILDNISS